MSNQVIYPESSEEITTPEILAHDIRNCIFAIANTLEVIRLATKDKPEVRKSIEISERQLSLLKDLASKVRLIADSDA
jgi:hypothetical protein